MDKLAGRVAVVTGAASGIGRGIAEALAAQGMRIVAADIDGAQLAVTGAELRGAVGISVALPSGWAGPYWRADMHRSMPGRVGTSVFGGEV